MATKRKIARAKRVKPVKRTQGYTSAPVRISPQIDLLHAAHRGRMGAAIAASAAEQLKSVAQVMLLASDTAKRRGEVPPAVASAIQTADQMLTAQISELERLGGDVPLGPVDVADVVTRATALIREAAPKKIKITVDTLEPIAPAKGSPIDFTEIVYALLLNSVEALAIKGGRIHVSTAKTSSSVRVVVQDDGPGLAPVVKRHLFEPYVRPRADGSSLGIGLAVSRELARRNGGDLIYETRPGRGARFVLTAPRWVSTPRRVLRRDGSGPR